MEKIKFNSFLDPIKVEPTDCSDPWVSQNELGYNEKGQVVIIEKPKKNIQEEINSYENETLLSEQLKRIARGEQKPRQGQFMDVSEAPQDQIELMQQSKKLKAKEAELQRKGFDTEALLRANEEELKKLILEYVAKETEKKETKTNEQPK